MKFLLDFLWMQVLYKTDVLHISFHSSSSIFCEEFWVYKCPIYFFLLWVMILGYLKTHQQPHITLIFSHLEKGIQFCILHVSLWSLLELIFVKGLRSESMISFFTWQRLFLPRAPLPFCVWVNVHLLRQHLLKQWSFHHSSSCSSAKPNFALNLQAHAWLSLSIGQCDSRQWPSHIHFRISLFIPQRSLLGACWDCIKG